MDVVFHFKPIPGYRIIEIKKASYKEFYNYCKKAGIPDDIIDEIWRISRGYVENARYYIRIVKKFGIKNKREFKKFFRKRFPKRSFIIASFISATAKYFFYFIGFFSVGNFFAAVSYVFMIIYFVWKK